jgi:hypothetical protein
MISKDFFPNLTFEGKKISISAMGLVINSAPFAWNCKFEILLGILLCCALLFSLYLFL